MTHLAASFGFACSVASFAVACGGNPPTPPRASTARTSVVTTLGFILHSPDGTIEGFDVDGATSTGLFTDGTGCGLADQFDSTCHAGIDNNLAPTFESIVELTGDAVDGLLRMAINDGSLLIIFRLEGVDDPWNDPDVTVRLYKGTGRPQLATTGRIAPSQTFEVDPWTPSTEGPGRIENGVFYGGPFEAVIPLKIFGVSSNIRLHNALVRGRFQGDEDGCYFSAADAGADAGAADGGVIVPNSGVTRCMAISADGGVEDAGQTVRPTCVSRSYWMTNGIVGGGIEVDQIVDIANQAGENDHNAAIIASGANAFLAPYADLNFDEAAGICTHISAALRFETVPAYLVGD